MHFLYILYVGTYLHAKNFLVDTAHAPIIIMFTNCVLDLLI